MDHYDTMKAHIRNGGAVCPIRYAMSMIGQKWKIPILWHLADEGKALHYSELKRSIPGITDVMLSKCLDELEENGLVLRRQYDCIPPKTDYTLSERGKSLMPVLYTLHGWGEEQVAIDKR